MARQVYIFESVPVAFRVRRAHAVRFVRVEATIAAFVFLVDEEAACKEFSTLATKEFSTLATAPPPATICKDFVGVVEIKGSDEISCPLELVLQFKF